jgi:tetratricopeptide repeat protein 8
VWLLKCRSLTEKNYIDDSDWDEEGIGEVLLDDNAIAQAPRPGTSLSRPATSKNTGMPDAAMRPMTASGRPLTGFARPGTTSARVGTGSGAVDAAFKGSRPGTSRAMTAMGRAVRIGTASMLTTPGGPFINVDKLDLKRYASRPAIAKALCDYILYVDHNPRKAMELASAATVSAGFGDWWWKLRLGKCYFQLGLLRDAEKQIKSSLRQQEMVTTYLELAKVYLKLDQPAVAHGTTHTPGATNASFSNSHLVKPYPLQKCMRREWKHSLVTHTCC